MTNIEFHPYCVLFPSCSEEELKTLADDILQNGLLEPVVLLDGKILDGRNRYLACLQSNITLKTVEFAGDDPLAFVLSKNLHRRHLTESQRAIIAANIANMRRGYNQREQSANLPITQRKSLSTKGVTAKNNHKNTSRMRNTDASNLSQRETAKIMNVSERSVHAASKILKEASPKIIQQIRDGKKSLHAAISETKSKPQKKKIIAKEPKNQSNVTIKWQDLKSASVDLPLSDDAEHTFETICQAFGFRGDDLPRRKELSAKLEELGNELEKLANWIRTIAD